MSATISMVPPRPSLEGLMPPKPSSDRDIEHEEILRDLLVETAQTIVVVEGVVHIKVTFSTYEGVINGICYIPSIIMPLISSMFNTLSLN